MKKGTIFVCVCLSLFFVFTGCQKKITLAPGISFEKEKNIQYGNDPEQVMDMYIPYEKPTKKREVFIIIHGGGWRAGDKSQLTFFALSLMKKFPDHIFVNLNYRLASEMSYALPNQIYDIN